MKSLDQRLQETAVLAALFHDLGKATHFFQIGRLKQGKKTVLTRHSAPSAILVWWWSNGADLQVRLGAFVAVLRHHGSLKYAWWDELAKLRLEADDPKSYLRQQLANMDLSGVAQWLDEAAERFSLPWVGNRCLSPTVDEIFLALKTPNTQRMKKTAYSDLTEVVGFLAGFGALLSEDKLDAALEGEKLNRWSLNPNLVDHYKKQVFGSSKGQLAQLRDTLAMTVQKNWLQNLSEHHLTLTAPTGSGKTLAIMGAALKARNALGNNRQVEPRIIYCLPFTSIIEQNCEVFSDVLERNGISPTQDLLLKHHHLNVPSYHTQTELEYEADGAGELLTETWQSEIVVTTFHQFLYTLLSAANRNLKRAAQLAEAIVLLDEVQAIPLKYWGAVRELLKATSIQLNTRFVLLTATRPLIYQAGDAIELLPDHETYFRALSRVELSCHHEGGISTMEFAEELATRHHQSSQPFLVVVNRRRTVAELFKHLKAAFPARPIFPLSTYLTPQHRRERINQIRLSLEKGEPCIAITTQLIEAGVDISFPTVHRDMAPLDCIIQAAGRCNRHMELRQGRVHLWRLLDKVGKPQWQRIYDVALIQATQDVIGSSSTYQEADFLSLTERYFQTCWQRADQDPIHESLMQGNFDGLSRFQLIEDGPPTRSFFVITNSEDQTLWDRYLAVNLLSPGEARKAFAPFRRQFFDRVIQVYGPAQEEIESLKVGEGHYDLELGFIHKPDETAALIL